MQTTAQDSALVLRRVAGVVRASKDGAALANVSVSIKGTSQGTVTDEEGRFLLQAHPGDTLVVTAVGFARLEHPCGQAAMLQLALPEARNNLDQVMVIGYGGERKRNITGSISSIDAAELEKSPALSFDNAIVGKAAGVNILSSSGVPGSATGITIRGLSALNSDGNQPLIVIDGVPVYGSGKSLNTSNFQASTTAAVSFGGTYVSDNLEPAQSFENNPLANLNPADIESIEILKDAYATSIYGSRGAAGVILVTTKKGNRGKPKVNARYVIGTVQPIGRYNLLNGPEYNQVYTEYYKELGQNAVFNSPYNTDWQDEVLRTAITQQADVSLSAGSDKAQYYFSGSYTSQPTYVINSNYDRYTGRLNLTYNPSNAWTAGMNMSVSYTNNGAINAPQVYRDALRKAPNVPVMDEAGNYVYDAGTNPIGDLDINPVADARLNTNVLQTTQTLGNVFLQYKPVGWLSLRSEFGTDMSTSEAYTRRVKRPSGFGDDAVQTSSQLKKIVVNNTVNFLRTLNNRHYINAVAGQSYEQSVETSMGIGGYGFFSDDIRSVAAAENTYIKSALTQKWALVSYFARLNYELDNKYLAGITYRVDGSSKFSANRRYVGFPSISAGWRLSQEGFMKQLSWIDDLKLRGSIGFTGNNNSTSYYGSQGQYSINSNGLSYAGVPVLQMQQPDNPNLKWERTRSIDAGLDASLWNHRLSVTLDYYQRRVKDMILSSAIPAYQGWTAQPQNIGDMMNYGVELMLEGDLVKNSAVTWTATFNASFNRNKILRLNFEGKEVGLANDAYKFLKEGQPAGLFYLYDWQGVDPFTGDPLWGDGKGGSSYVPPSSRYAEVADVNEFRQIAGSSMPDIFGGMGHTVTWKGWQLDAFLSYSIGNKMINGSRASLLTYTTDDAGNLGKEILDYWLVPGHVTDIPKLANKSITVPTGSTGSSVRDYTTSRTSSRFLEDGSYLRLRTLSLTYSLSPDLLRHIKLAGMRSMQVFVRATNLFTWTAYSGLDPEVNAFGSSAIQSGYDELSMPQNKMYQFGINLGL